MTKFRFTVEMCEESTDRDIVVYDIATFEVPRKDAWQILGKLEDAERMSKLPTTNPYGLMNQSGCVAGSGLNTASAR